VYVHPDDHAKVKTLVAKLCKARSAIGARIKKHSSEGSKE
jgi:hypothetical protein